MTTRSLRTHTFNWLLTTVVLVGTWASPVASAADLKIGYVNAVRAIEQAPQGKAALKRLESEFSPRDKELVRMQDRIKAVENELEKNSLVLKESDRQSKEREVISLKRDLKRATQEFREDYNVRRNEELLALQKIVHKAIVDIAKQEKYDLILHEGVIYAGDKIDITEQILKILGKK